MSGLAKICKIYGGLKATQNGKTVQWVWDYANDVSAKREDMPIGSERHKASEQAKWNSYNSKEHLHE